MSESRQLNTKCEEISERGDHPWDKKLSLANIYLIQDPFLQSVKRIKVSENSSVNKYSSSLSAKIVHRSWGISAAVQGFTPKVSSMENAHSEFFHCKFYNNSASGRRICTYKTI